MSFPYAKRYFAIVCTALVASVMLTGQVRTLINRRPAQASTESADYAERARKIASKSLQTNIVKVKDTSDPTGFKKFLTAGAHQFRTLWVRDFSFASTGAIVIGEGKAVRDSLEAIFSKQRPDGLLPRVLDNENLTWRFVSGMFFGGIPFGYPLNPGFETEHSVIAIDGNALAVWKAAIYVERTKDRAFAQKWFPNARQSLRFLETEYWNDGLVGKQQPYADWADSVPRTGRVAFTNELYIVALKALAQWATFLGKAVEAKELETQAQVTLEKFRKFFLVTQPDPKLPQMAKGMHIRNYEQDYHLTADANLFAVAHGLLSSDESRQVMTTLKESALWDPYPGRATFPNYDDASKHGNVKTVDIQGYHDEFYWFWLTALAAQAERKVGDCYEFRRILNNLSWRIARDGAVYEVYESDAMGDLQPVDRTLYKPEYPFSWSAGMYLEVASQTCSR